jgi:hypothetical protein
MPFEVGATSASECRQPCGLDAAMHRARRPDASMRRLRRPADAPRHQSAQHEQRHRRLRHRVRGLHLEGHIVDAEREQEDVVPSAKRRRNVSLRWSRPRSRNRIEGPISSYDATWF